MTYQICCENAENYVALSEACAGSSGQISKDRSCYADLSSRLFLEVWNLGTVHPGDSSAQFQRIASWSCWLASQSLLGSSGILAHAASIVGRFPHLLSGPAVAPALCGWNLSLQALLLLSLLPLNPSVVPSCSENTTQVV